MDASLEGMAGYVQLEYAGKELADLFALSDIVISRAGANAIFELLALRKPNILIPLSAAASRGDQILNANSFKNSGYSYVLEEEKLSMETLQNAIAEVNGKKNTYISAMEQSQSQDSIRIICNLIETIAKKN